MKKHYFLFVNILIIILIQTISSSKIYSANTLMTKNNWWIDVQLTSKNPSLTFNKNDNTDLTTFHFYSHGKSGQLLIDGKWLNQNDLAVYFSKLIAKKDIKHLNIYGCEFAKGEKGFSAVKYLEYKLGITISASTNITGIDGDWKLEVGRTNTSISIPDFEGNLQYGAAPCMGAQTVTMAFAGTPTITGTANTVGSTYRYPNVLQGSGVTQQVDAVFTLNSLNFGSSTIQQSVNFQFDVPASTIGIENNFQPSFIGSTLSPYPALGTYVLSQQWTVTFYLAGTTTPANLPIIVQVYDNDGTTSSYYINEIITFNTPPSSIVTSSAGATPTTETVNGNTVTSDNSTQSGIGNGLQYMVYANYASVSSFQMTIKDSIQFTNPSTTWGSRYHSFIIGCQNPGATNFPCAAGTIAPTLSGTSATNTCPLTTVNLNSLVTSSTTNLVWFTNNAHTGTAYATPTTAGAGTYYAFYYDSTNDCYSPASSAVAVSIASPCPPPGCPYGTIHSYQYATSATGNGHADGTNAGIVGIPDVNTDVTDVIPNRFIVYNTTAVVQFANPIKAGDTITIYAARHINTVLSGDFTVSLNGTPSNSGVISTVTSSQITTIANNNPWVPYNAIQVIVPASATGSYSSINLEPTSILSFTYVDAIQVSETNCNTCASGINAPTLTSSYYGFCSPATSYNLTTLAASNIPSGSTLSWHTGTPASSSNEVATPTSVTDGTYYAAIKNGSGASACYSGINGDGTATTKVVIGKDSDCDGVPDSIDLDDDNDGVLDVTEMQTIACSGSVGQWRYDVYDEYANPNGGFYCPFWPTESSWVSGGTTNQYGSLNVVTTNSPSANTMLASMGIINSGPDNDPRWLIRFSKTVPLNSAPNQTLTLVNNGSNGDLEGLKINGISVYCYSAYFTCPVCDPSGTFTYTVQPGDVISFDITENDIGTNSYNTQLNLDCSQLVDIDTDGDNIPNRLDTDSDNDGCTDAFEAGTSMSNVETLAGPFGINGFVDAKEQTAPESGIYNGTYTYNNAIDSNTLSCTQPCTDPLMTSDNCDYDGDGVLNNIDLDDDNDGILDLVECPVPNLITNGGFTNGLTGWSGYLNNSDGWHLASVDGYAPNMVSINADNAVGTGYVIKQTVNFNQANVTGGMVHLSFDAGTNNFAWQGATYPIAVNATVKIMLGGVLYASLTNPDYGLTATTSASNGATITPSTFTVWSNQTTDPQSQSNLTHFDMYIPAASLPASGDLQLMFNASQYGDDWYFSNFVLDTSPTVCDTDGDSIPDRLDLDSDGDGCTDAIEGGANFTTSALYDSALPGGNSGSVYRGNTSLEVIQNLGNDVDANGVPMIATSTGQSTGSSQDVNVQDVNCLALPIKLSLFDAKNIDCKVNLLSWITASEVNSELFEIERSEDGKNFELIGYVDAAHNSTTNRAYQFKDYTTKTAYYRLKMVDIDKSFEYSDIIFLKSCSGNALEIGALSPNPASSDLSLTLKTEYNREVNISIFNALGQLMLALPKQHLNIGQNNIQIDVNELPNSTYFLRVDADNVPYFMTRFVKEQ